MAKVSEFKKLLVENFPDQASWIGPLFRSVNDFMEAVGSALKGNLTILDNLTSAKKEITVAATATNTTVSFSNPFRTQPLLVFVSRINATVAGTPVAIPAYYWTLASSQQSGGAPLINVVLPAGLTADTKYTFIIVAFGG